VSLVRAARSGLDTKIEQAKEIAEKAIGQLAESLEWGHSDELKKYLAAMARFPRYSLQNVLLILSQRPDTTRVAGFHTWRQLGRQVNRGAKGILIFAPMVRRKAENQEAEESSDVRGRSVKLVGFRGVYVFAEEDTSGQPLPRLSRSSGDPSAFADRLRQFVTSRGIQLKYSEDIRPAQGQCSAGKIELLPGMEPAVEFSVLAHEVGHSANCRFPFRRQGGSRLLRPSHGHEGSGRTATSSCLRRRRSEQPIERVRPLRRLC
jgi:hypothetical protein